MLVDGCQYSFTELAQEVLPRHMASLREAISEPMGMADFAEDGVGVKTLLARVARSEDFSGCYVMLDGPRPFYVGISRRVFSRLRQHVRGTTHFDATLTYRIATARTGHAMRRSDAMADPEFLVAFDEAQAQLRRLNVASVEIVNSLELYVFEAYCALERTSDWNTFATH